MTAALVEFHDVRLGYGRRTVLDRITMDVRPGDLLGLVGPNGAGKTTLLRALLGTLAPLSGTVAWAAGRRPRIGYVPQRESLDPVWPLSCLDVVLMGRCALRGPLRRLGAADRSAALAALGAAGIEDLAAAPVADLSGGQVQRTLLARALAAEPDLLVLDEPTTGMDLEGADAMLALVRRLHAERRLTVVLVSHDLNAVAAVATRVALLHEGSLREGDVESILSSEVLGAVYGLPVAVGTVGGRRVVAVENRR